MSAEHELDDFRRPGFYTPEFEAHAHPDAIRRYMELARARQLDIQNELGWLEGLLIRRSRELAERA